MPNSMTERIAKSHTAAISGEISFAEAALAQQERALELFPLAKTVGEALQKYGETAIGKKDFQNLKDLQFLLGQWNGRLGNGAQAVMKSEGGFPKIHMAQSEGIDGDSDGGGGEIEEPHDKEDPDDALQKMGEDWRRTHPDHPMSKTKEMAVTHVMTTPEGRALLERSKMKCLRKNAE